MSARALSRNDEACLIPLFVAFFLLSASPRRCSSSSICHRLHSCDFLSIQKETAINSEAVPVLPVSLGLKVFPPVASFCPFLWPLPLAPSSSPFLLPLPTAPSFSADKDARAQASVTSSGGAGAQQQRSIRILTRASSRAGGGLEQGRPPSSSEAAATPTLMQRHWRPSALGASRPLGPSRTRMKGKRSTQSPGGAAAPVQAAVRAPGMLPTAGRGVRAWGEARAGRFQGRRACLCTGWGLELRHTWASSTRSSAQAGMR